jgi:hypothetical protein
MGTVVLAAGPVNVDLVGIPSTEQFGTLQIGGISQVSLLGIPTEEAFGLLRTMLYVNALGAIGSGEVFPLPIISSSYSLFALGNIVSAEAFGVLLVAGGAVIYDPPPYADVTSHDSVLQVAQQDSYVTVSGGKSYAEVTRG